MLNWTLSRSLSSRVGSEAPDWANWRVAHHVHADESRCYLSFSRLHFVTDPKASRILYKHA